MTTSAVTGGSGLLQVYSHFGEPLYSSQGPVSYDHSYQRTDQFPCYDNHVNHLEHLYHRLGNLKLREISKHQDQSELTRASSDTYHYGRSNYSTTEPLYAHPQNPPGECICCSSSHLPRAVAINSMVDMMVFPSNNHNSPTTRGLVRADRTGVSISSTTLPSVATFLYRHQQALDDSKKKSAPHLKHSNSVERAQQQGFLESLGAKLFLKNQARGRSTPCKFLLSLWSGWATVRISIARF